MALARMRPPESAAVIEGEVPFHDVDALQIVWHGHYFKYFEVARTKLFVRHEIDGKEMLELGFRFVVAQTECKHVSPLTYRDRYRVSAWFLGPSEHRVDVHYEIWNLTQDKRAARGRTALVTTDGHGTLLLTTPELIQQRIRKAARSSESP